MDTLTLPADLREIQTEAFAGSTAESVVFGGEVTAIGSRAFADNTSLKQIVIPAEDVTLEENCFADSEPVFICREDSTAHEYAVSNGFTCVFFKEN